MIVRYEIPKDWIAYDRSAIFEELMTAKAAMLALTQIPWQKSWANELQKLQLKREVAGTSRIEGAEFTEQELDRAMRTSADQLETRSQKQAAAAVTTYGWIANLEPERPLDEMLVCDIHRRLVTGCDDDHCPPGQLRGRDQNVTFGAPRHRGAEGGTECEMALRSLTAAARGIYREHDPFVQALAVHYHFASIHPFLDGNGRTARALEALLLQRTGLRDTLFIAMSNYYYEHKTGYLNALSAAREANHDLTTFIKFGLLGIERQCQRLFGEIRKQVVKALYRNTVTDLFGRLLSPRKRAVSARHAQILNLLLNEEEMTWTTLAERTRHLFTVGNPSKALSRDLLHLVSLGAISLRRLPDNQGTLVVINLNWPTLIDETEFLRGLKELPKGKTHGFPSF